MNKTLDVARYVINHSFYKHNGISNLKLQKVLYFIQVYFLVKTEKPCFDGIIEAWDFGPVVPEAYKKWEEFGSTIIYPIELYIEYNHDNIWLSEKIRFDETIINETDRKMINDIVDKFANYTSTDLVSMTHKQTPWKDAYKASQTTKITHDALLKYFKERIE